MINEVFMPALSSTMTEGKIVSWVKSPGDKVEKGETVVVVESDKADMDVESFYEGYLATIVVQAGDVAGVGATIALIAETEAEIETAKQKAASVSAPATPASAPSTAPVAVPAATVPTETASRRNGRVIASPRAKKLAKELKVDLNSLRAGSGPHGRIIAEDVEMAAGKSPTPPSLASLPTLPPMPAPVAAPQATPMAIPTAPPAALSTAGGEVTPMTTLQNAVAQNMMASLGVPCFRVGYTITTDGLDQLYKQLKAKGVTMTALLAKAVAITLRKHPLLNSCYVDRGIQHRSAINIAIGVAMPDGGLITPVLAGADHTDIYSLARSWKDLVDRARLKQLQPQEYTTGTFTLSNLGMFGVDRFDAIVPPGQGAILAIGASRPQVVATADGMFGVKQQMQVNITCDHRVIYGAHAAAFLQDLAKLIETSPQSLVM